MTKDASKCYAVWVDTEDDPDEHYWALYDTMDGALTDNHGECDLYEMRPKFLGRFKATAKIVKIKAKK